MSLIKGLESADSNELEDITPLPVEKRRFHRSRSKVKAKGLKYQPEIVIKRSLYLRKLKRL